MTIMLTKKQLKVFDFIVDHVKKERIPPTVREISEACETVGSNVHRMLRLLEREGYIKVHTAKPRGIEVIKQLD